jgi:hypothetical protein
MPNRPRTSVVIACDWKGNADLQRFTGKPIRLHLVMKDADLYALRFGGNEN